MSKINELLVEMMGDVEKSVELFGVSPEILSTLDVSPNLASDWADWHFEGRSDKSPEADVQLYLSWFRTTHKFMKERETVALARDKTFNVEDK